MKKSTKKTAALLLAAFMASCPTGVLAAEEGSTADSGHISIYDGQPVPSLEGFTVAVCVQSTDHEFDLLAAQGQVDCLNDLGAEVIFSDGNKNDQQHIADLENAILLEPDAIMKQLGDTKVYEDVLSKVHESGIPLFTVDHASPYSICNVTTNNYNMSAELATRMYSEIGTGSMAIFNGFYGVRVNQIRVDQMYYVADDFHNISFIEPELQEINPGTVEDAYAKTQDLLTKYPAGSELKGIWVSWDTPCIGIVQAVDEAGRDDIKVYGIDGNSSVLDMVGAPDSAMSIDMAQNPYEIGYTAAEMVARYLNGEQVPSVVYVDYQTVTKSSDVDAVKEWMHLDKIDTENLKIRLG